MHIVIYLINYDLGFAIYMYLYLGVMILLFAQCIDRDRLTLPSLHGKQACLLWVWVLLVRVADHALQREAEQGVAVWDACGAASHYGLMMPIAKATSHSFLPFPIGILASFLLIICVIMV